MWRLRRIGMMYGRIAIHDRPLCERYVRYLALFTSPQLKNGSNPA
jgi:hypothetical protein